MSSNIVVKFGKYKGQPLSNMLKDTKYISWVKTTDIPQKHPDIYEFLFPPAPEVAEAPPVSEPLEAKVTPTIDEIQTVNDEEVPTDDGEESKDDLIKRVQALEEDNQRLRSEVMRLKLMLKEKTKEPTPFKDDEQDYGVITKVLGGCNFEVSCLKDSRKRLGRLARRKWVILHDVVLISLRDYQDEKCDILFKYSYVQVKILKRGNHIKSNVGLDGVEQPETTVDANEEEIEFGDL